MLYIRNVKQVNRISLVDKAENTKTAVHMTTIAVYFWPGLQLAFQGLLPICSPASPDNSLDKSAEHKQNYDHAHLRHVLEKLGISVKSVGFGNCNDHSLFPFRIVSPAAWQAAGS